MVQAGPGPAKLGERLQKQRGDKGQPLVEVLAFALMPNHYHLIIREIIRGGISLFMIKMAATQPILISNMIASVHCFSPAIKQWPLRMNVN